MSSVTQRGAGNRPITLDAVVSQMKTFRVILSVGWLAVALYLLFWTIYDTTFSYLGASMLAIESGATLLAAASATYLFFELRWLRAVTIVSSALFLVYWIYLFLTFLSNIVDAGLLNETVLRGLGTICLAGSTVGFIVFARKQSGVR